MKTQSVAIVLVLALAGIAHGFQLVLTETGVVDNGGGSYTSTVEMAVDLEGADSFDGASALGLGSTDAAGAMTLDSYTNLVPGWDNYVIVPPPGYVIGSTDLVDPYYTQMVSEGYELAGFSANLTSNPTLIATMTITHTGNVNLTASAANIFDATLTIIEYNKYGNITLSPEPATAMFLALSGPLLLRRRRFG